MTKDYFKKQSQRIKQKILILTSRSDFLNDILELRKKWNIKTKGFDNDQKSHEWQDWLNEVSEKYSDDNWSQERDLEEKLAKDGNWTEKEQANKKFNDQVPINNFRNDILSLIKKYKLSKSWENSIKRYLLFNDINNMSPPMGNLSLVSGWEDGFRKLSIELDANTTLEDIKNIWPYVMLEQKKLGDKTTDKFQPIKMFERDCEAYKLKQSGMPYEKIADVLSEKYGKDYGYEDIGSFIKRYKQKTGIN